MIVDFDVDFALVREVHTKDRHVHNVQTLKLLSSRRADSDKSQEGHSRKYPNIEG